MPYKIPASVREEIISKLLTSERRKYLWKEVGPTIERIVEEPEVRRAYLGGSFVTSRRLPKDVDLLIRTKKSLKENIAEKGLHWPRASLEEHKLPLDIYSTEKLNAPRTGRYEPIAKDLLRVGRRKYGKDYKWTRIAGLTGALGGTAAMTQPQEAEASPIGKAITTGAKAAKTALKGVPSRTSSLLKGTEFMGQSVKKITKGKGNWRNIILEDGTVYPVTKDVASDLVRHQGTVEKMTEFGFRKPSGPSAVMGGASQIDQAFKSLSYHESRSNPYLPQKTIRENYKAYLGQVKDAGLGDAIPYSLVKRGSRTFTIPTPYAQLLEKEGYLKIVKELK